MRKVLVSMSVFIGCSALSFPACANPPYTEDSLSLTLKNSSQQDAVQFGLNENVTIQFTDSKTYSEPEIDVMNYNESSELIEEGEMSETDNGDGTYTYAHTFNTDSVFSGVADWYFYTIKDNSPKVEMQGHFIVGMPVTPHSIKTYSDSGYSTESDQFSLTDTLYVEVIGDDNGNEVTKKKVKILAYDQTKHVESNIGDLTNQSGTYRFSIDLSSPKTAFTVDWWYTLDVELKQKKGKSDSFRGQKQILIKASSPSGGQKWNQLNWREVD